MDPYKPTTVLPDHLSQLTSVESLSSTTNHTTRTRLPTPPPSESTFLLPSVRVFTPTPCDPDILPQKKRVPLTRTNPTYSDNQTPSPPPRILGNNSLYTPSQRLSPLFFRRISCKVRVVLGGEGSSRHSRSETVLCVTERQ